MSTTFIPDKPHALCIPSPSHGHINAMLKLAKVLHSQGLHVTFVNTEFNHRRLLQSGGPNSLDGVPGFQFETIPDGLPPSDDINPNTDQDMFAVIESLSRKGSGFVKDLIEKLNHGSEGASLHDPPVSCIVWDCILPCTPQDPNDFDIPQVVFWPMSAAFLTPYLHFHQTVEKCLFPLKGKELFDMPIDFIPGLDGFRVKDLPSFFWDGNDALQYFLKGQVEKATKASAIILHTFDALESKILDSIKSLVLTPIYTIGPLNLLERQIPNEQFRSLRSNLLKENKDCLEWLDSKPPESVVYVNFGSTTVITRQQLIEFGWGLANCKHPFLWVIRPDLVIGEEAVLPHEFMEETAGRSMISGWCPQEKVLDHSSVAVFLTHNGWNSTMDAICSGVPIISWPFFGDQQTNCWSACVQWGTGVEINKNVTREAIEGLVKEVMEGEKGKEMKKRAIEWKNKGEVSSKEGGSSSLNLEKIVKEVLLLAKLK